MLPASKALQEDINFTKKWQTLKRSKEKHLLNILLRMTNVSLCREIEAAPCPFLFFSASIFITFSNGDISGDTPAQYKLCGSRHQGGLGSARPHFIYFIEYKPWGELLAITSGKHTWP